MNLKRPKPSEPFLDARGLITRPWFNYLADLSPSEASASIEQQLQALGVRVTELEDIGGALPNSTRAYGQMSVESNGTLAGGVVVFSLVGDVQQPGNTLYYGTGPDGLKGWYNVSDAIDVESGQLTKDVGDDGVTTLGLAEVTDSGEGALLALERDEFGRVTGTKAATITGTAGQIDVANGDAVAGLPTISLADLADAGGGALRKFARDGKGRVSGTSDATTDDLAEGAANFYYTDLRVDTRVQAGNYTITGTWGFANNITIGGMTVGLGPGQSASNLAIGSSALSSRTSGLSNIAIGSLSMQSLTTGTVNIAIGSSALRNSVNAGSNIAIGGNSLSDNISGGGNIAIGRESIRAGGAQSGSAGNVAIGRQSLENSTSGSACVAIGYFAGKSATGGTGCVYVGSQSGESATPANANLTGQNNTFIGTFSGPETPTQVSNSTAVGYRAVVGTSNTVALGRVTDTTVIGATGNDGSGAKLQVTGTIKADGLKQTPASATVYATPALAALSSVSASFTVAGAALGDRIEATHSAAVGAGLQVTGRATAANTVEITFTNTSASALAATAGTLRIWITKP